MADSHRGDMGERVDILVLVRDMRDQILREMNSGFKGVHHRQDVANGRTAKLEDATGRLDERVEALCERLETVEKESEAFHLHRRSTDPVPPAKDAKDSGDDRRITQRDVRWVALGAGAAIGLIKLLPWLASLAQVGKP